MDTFPPNAIALAVWNPAKSNPDGSTGGWELINGVSGTANVSDQAVHAVRNPNSATDAYDGNVPLARGIVISAQPGPFVIGSSAGANDIRLVAVNVLKALTGTVTLTGFKDQAGAAASIIIPAGGVGLYEFGMLNDGGQLTVALNNAADVNLVVVRYWPA